MTDTEIQIKALVSEIHNLKKNFAIKLEEYKPYILKLNYREI